MKNKDIFNRIRESQFKWINSNIPAFNDFLPPDIPTLPTTETIQVISKANPNISKKVTLLGLCTNDPEVMLAGSFGGAEIKHINSTVKQLYYDLENSNAPDLIIPMTHQCIADDRHLARMIVGLCDEYGNESMTSSSKRVVMNKIPLILGGHEHELFHEVKQSAFPSNDSGTEKVYECTIFKAGMDINYIGVIDFTWPYTDETCTQIADTPIMTIHVKKSSQYEEDARVKELVHQHSNLLRQLVRP